MISAIDNEAWGYVAVLIVTFVALNVAYLPRRFVPMKYLLPGVFFLIVFALYPVLYTAYASTTNYGTGHVLTKAQAIDQIQSQSVRPVEGATRYDVTPLEDADGLFAGFALYDPEAEQLFLGTETELTELDLADAQLTTLATTGRTFVESVGDYTGVRAGDVRALPGYPADPRRLRDAGRDRGRGDHDLRRAGRREHHDAACTTPMPARSPTSRRASSTTRTRASSSPRTAPS